MTLPETLGYVKLILDTFGLTPAITAVGGVVTVITSVAYILRLIRFG